LDQAARLLHRRGSEPASQRNRLRLRFSRLHSFRTKVSPAVRSPAGCSR
jgi:hypothetical protein